AAAPFSARADFEMYNMGHLLTAACLHHRVTGSDAFLDVARRTADFLASTFSNPTAELARNSVCPSHYMGAIDMYRATGERRYLDLAQKFLDMRNLVVDGGDDNQDRIPFLDQREAVGHAVRANYLYAGAADLYLETGDERLWAPLEACWRSVVERKMYVTGGCGALYDGASPDGSENQAQISRVHQAYGRNYQLPQTTAHNETCAAIGSVLWNWRMFLATGDAKYVDVLELALYNSVLAGVSLSGEDYFYVNPLRQVEPLPAPLRWPRRRVPFVVSYCCPPNVLRTIAQSASYAYAAAEDGAYVNLYCSSTLSTTHAGEPLKLSQTTEYPWDGRVRIAIEACPSAPFALHVRIPGWSGAATVRINGRPLETFTAPGAFVELKREWSPGDVVDID
ncbi:MAG TPA: glycoside hydrolase family 127 protein, partial [Lacipirellulaceae bacterium]|nr:glycoside hydrolase family 127 protein [Lacipirellulaceae bacterium]